MNASAPLPPTTMRAVLSDPNLLGRVMSGASWLPWRVLLIAMMGEALTDAERVVFTKLTGRSHEPLQRVESFWAITGRRGGKGYAMAVLLVYLSVFVDYRRALTFGEQAIVLCLSQTQEQARVVFNYGAGIFEAVPLLAPLVRQRIAETLSLTNGIDIQIRAASFRGLRGLTLAAVVADEIAFWFDQDSANPDTEILGAVTPAFATTGGPLICITTPHGRRGAAYETSSQNFGQKGDPLILVAQGSTRDFNESFPQAKVDRAMEKDPAFARSEHYGLWRDDIAAFIDRLTVEACVERGRVMRPPLRTQSYFGYVDAAGGSGKDSFTAAVAHRVGERVVLDAILEFRPPFNPENVVREVSATLKTYRVFRAFADRYGGGFPPAAFLRHGMTIDPSPRITSDVFLTALPLMTSGLADLLDLPRLISQLVGLERRTSRGGKQQISHAQNPNAHDDVAAAACGALVSAMEGKGVMRISQAAIDRAGPPRAPLVEVGGQVFRGSW